MRSASLDDWDASKTRKEARFTARTTERAHSAARNVCETPVMYEARRAVQVLIEKVKNELLIVL